MRLLFIGIIVLAFAIYFYESNYQSSKLVTHIEWMAPFYSGGGYGSEAIATISALNQLNLPISEYQIKILHHGDSINQKFINGLPNDISSLLFNLSKPFTNIPDIYISICHSEPGAWYPANYMTSRCPPLEFQNPNENTTYYTIGRTMFETDRLPNGWNDRCNKFNEIWVPTDFHMKIFQDGGIHKDKLVKIPEPVDTKEFNRFTVNTLEINKYISMEMGMKPTNYTNNYKFLSIFKWEDRKGWKILLESYFTQFLGYNNVSLFLLTQPYHNEPNYISHIEKFMINELPELVGSEKLPHLAFITYPLPQTLLPSLYKSVNCFVLPSRGEGWGRPHIEAMAMGLPTIATNWSGNLEFMKDWNSYLIKVESLIEIESGPFKGHKWANPSITNLKEIMKYVVDNPKEAKRKGHLGEGYVRSKYSPISVATIIYNRIKEIKESLTIK